MTSTQSVAVYATLILAIFCVNDIHCDPIAEARAAAFGEREARSDGEWKQFDVNGEKIEVNEQENREIIRQAGGDGVEGSVMVIDHAKGLISWSIPRAGECYLIGGVDKQLPDAQELLHYFQSAQGSADGEGVESALDYVKAEDRPVTDLNLLAPEVREACQGKSVYWLEKSSGDNNEPEKRRWCVYAYVRVRGVLVRYRRCW
nr:arenicin-1.1 [Arenicola marina]